MRRVEAISGPDARDAVHRVWDAADAGNLAATGTAWLGWHLCNLLLSRWL